VRVQLAGRGQVTMYQDYLSLERHLFRITPETS